MTSPAAATAASTERHSIGFNLGVIALGAALVALAAAYLLEASEHSGPPAPAGTLTRTLGERTLHIPAAWLDPGAEHGGSFARQVDFTVGLPLGPGGAKRNIEVTLTQRSRVRPSAALLDGVYLHQFMPEQLNGPPGLIGKPLVAADGYENETVWYDPIDPAPFVAKCATPVTPDQPGHCLRAVYLGPGMAAIYSFDADVLGSWRSFDATLQPLLRRIGAV